MPRRRRILISLILLTGLGLALWWWTGREPSYQGRKLSEWCDLAIVQEVERQTELLAVTTELDRPVATPGSGSACEAIVKMGDRSIECMMRWDHDLNADDGWVDKAVLSVCKHVGFLDRWNTRRVRDRADRIKKESSRAFAIAQCQWDRAAKMVPSLMARVVSRHDPAWENFMGNIFEVHSCWLVVGIGPAAMPEVLPYLSHQAKGVQAMARGIIGLWGTNALTQAVPALELRLASPDCDRDERYEIWWAFVDIRHRLPEAASFLAGLLDHYDSSAYQHMQRLVDIGRTAVPQLAAAMVHTNPAVRMEVFNQIERGYYLASIASRGVPEEEPADWLEKSELFDEVLRFGGPPARLACLESARAQFLRKSEHSGQEELSESLLLIKRFVNDPDPGVVSFAKRLLEELCLRWKMESP